MLSEEIEVCNKIGFHARPATILMDTAKRFESTIFLHKGNKKCDLRSIISLMKLQVKMGDVVRFEAIGADEQQAIDALVELVKSRFGEE